ncbi:hypothetical protein LY76DRAFT_7313 [Colletotrichum caudatum]|nr:hypothetical protein LY76DRAFT_7313 [Colletotrichum caudatum]
MSTFVGSFVVLIHVSFSKIFFGLGQQRRQPSSSSIRTACEEDVLGKPGTESRVGATCCDMSELGQSRGVSGINHTKIDHVSALAWAHGCGSRKRRAALVSWSSFCWSCARMWRNTGPITQKNNNNKKEKKKKTSKIHVLTSPRTGTREVPGANKPRWVGSRPRADCVRPSILRSRRLRSAKHEGQTASLTRKVGAYGPQSDVATEQI